VASDWRTNDPGGSLASIYKAEQDEIAKEGLRNELLEQRRNSILSQDPSQKTNEQEKNQDQDLFSKIFASLFGASGGGSGGVSGRGFGGVSGGGFGGGGSAPKRIPQAYASGYNQEPTDFGQQLFSGVIQNG
jgi:hypothetical protein